MFSVAKHFLSCVTDKINVMDKEMLSTNSLGFSLSRCQSHSDSNQQSRCNLNMQIMLSAHSKGKMGYTDVPCTRLDQGTTFPPPSFRAHSVPIIPSVQGPDFGDGGGNKLHSRGRGASNYNLINPEAVANSSRSLASSSAMVQDPQTLTCSESALMSRGQIKHKSLVTYTTALGSGTSSRRAKTVISMTVLGSGAKTTQFAANLLSKATGGEEDRSAFGEAQQGDGFQTPFMGDEKDSSFSNGVRGVACLTYPKSWLDKWKDCFGNSMLAWMGLRRPRLCKTLTFGTILLHCEVLQLLSTEFETLHYWRHNVNRCEGMKTLVGCWSKKVLRRIYMPLFNKSFNLETK